MLMPRAFDRLRGEFINNIRTKRKNSMKKLMLIMAGALVSLSACSKSADEPVAQPQNQNAAE